MMSFLLLLQWSLDYPISRYPNYPLSELRTIRIEPSIIRTIARNFFTKLQITYRVKRDQAFIGAYHATNWLAHRPLAVSANA